MTNGWIGVDLDGTLARYDGWVGPCVIGEPVPIMVERVKAWLAAGREVKIFTARASGGGRMSLAEVQVVRAAIKAWCVRHIGQELEVTNVKDYRMVELWDDRAVGVIPNTGLRADGLG